MHTSHGWGRTHPGLCALTPMAVSATECGRDVPGVKGCTLASGFGPATPSLVCVVPFLLLYPWPGLHCDLMAFPDSHSVSPEVSLINLSPVASHLRSAFRKAGSNTRRKCFRTWGRGAAVFWLQGKVHGWNCHFHFTEEGTHARQSPRCKMLFQVQCGVQRWGPC